MLVLPYLAVLAQSQSSATQAPIALPKGTPVKLALGHALSSKANHVGDKVLFVVAEEVKDVKGHVLIAKGSTVEGSVTASDDKWDLAHWVGMLGVQAETAYLKDGTTVPLQLKPASPRQGDFRSRRCLAPPTPGTSETAAFYANQTPQKTNALVRAVGGKPSGGSGDQPLDPLEESSAVILSQILDFSQTAKVVKGLGDTNLFVVVKTLVTHKGFSQYAKKFSPTSAVSLIGAGVGLAKVLDIGKGMYQHVSFAPGALFDAQVAQDTQVMVPVPADGTKGPWHVHVRILKPHKFASRHNRAFLPRQSMPALLKRSLHPAKAER